MCYNRDMTPMSETRTVVLDQRQISFLRDLLNIELEAVLLGDEEDGDEQFLRRTMDALGIPR
jgi:hypothetical protein